MVKSESFSDVLFLGSRYAQHPLGGIRHKIYLFCVPELNIASLHVSTVFDKEFSNATMQVMLDIANESSYIDKTGRVLEKEVEDIRIGFELRDPEGRLVNIGTKDIKVSSIKSWQTLSYQVNIPVKAPKKWDPEHPNLYVLSCQLKAGGKKLQTSRQRFGFRQIEVRGNRLLVNGMPVKLRGIARHETHPILGRSLTPEMAREEVELYRKANINYIRTSHYPQAEEFMDMCDSLGMFVEEEAPICHVAVSYGHSTLWKKTHCFEPKYREAIVRPALEMVQRDRSHPSVILWSLGNESWWGSNFEASGTSVRKADPTRPISFSSQDPAYDVGFCEVGDDHYPNDPKEFTIDTDRPIVFDMPKAFDTLRWKRKAQWTVYPDDHIGRPTGEAKVFSNVKEAESWTKPDWSWFLDNTPFGTNDFCATRQNILNFSLTDEDANGIFVQSDGTQHGRAYVEGEQIRLLVAFYYTGRGGPRWQEIRYKHEQMPLKKGAILEDSVRLKLISRD